MQKVLKEYPDDVYTQDEDSNLPLHVACCNETTAATQIVMLVMAAAPEALEAVGEYGRLPLRCI